MISKQWLVNRIAEKSLWLLVNGYCIVVTLEGVQRPIGSTHYKTLLDPSALPQDDSQLPTSYCLLQQLIPRSAEGTTPYLH